MVFRCTLSRGWILLYGGKWWRWIRIGYDCWLLVAGLLINGFLEKRCSCLNFERLPMLILIPFRGNDRGLSLDGAEV